MTTAKEDIIVIEGRKDLLMIAPHGHHKDDENTADWTRLVASRLNCQAIVNFIFRKPRNGEDPDLNARLLNLNKSDHADNHPWFTDAIRSSVSTVNKTLVLWVHGVKDENIEKEAKLTQSFHGDPDELLILAGYGQGTSPKTGKPARFTAYPETAGHLISMLTAEGLTAVAVRDDAPTYRGRHEGYMNQWFLQNGYALASVESIQLELKYTGVRDRGSLETASVTFANALAALR